MKKEMTFFETVKRFFSLMQYRKKAYRNMFFHSFLRGIGSLYHIIFIERFIFFLTQNNYDSFMVTLVWYLVIIFIYEFLLFLFKKTGWIITIPMGTGDIYNIYLNKFLRLNNNHIEKIGTGKLIAIIDRGTFTWAESLAHIIEKGIMLVVAIVFSLYLILQHGVLFAPFFIGVLSVSLIIMVFINNHQFKYRRKRVEQRNERLRMTTKILMSKNEVLQSNKIDNEMSKIYGICNNLVGINKSMAIGRFFQNRTIPFAISLILVVLFYYFGNKVFIQEISLSQLVGLSSIFIIIQGTILHFIQFYIDFTKNFIDIEKLWDFFDSTPEMKGYDNGNTFKHKNGEINIQNLSYEYSKGKPVFTDFSLRIPGEKITALVGSSGSGKSTLVKLIAGYIQAEQGEIIVDDQKLSHTALKSYYADIGYLTQEPSVFDGTVLENLTYAIKKTPLNPLHEGKQKNSDSISPLMEGVGGVGDLEKIIKLAKCEFIYDLPEGINTEIGERGVRLSGGQKQRLAIAKIMLKDPKIIILDEPTSALDSFSEEQITKAMKNLFKNRTVIVIAHRLQTVKHADTILVLEEGEVVEQGNHSQLVEKKGIYAKMLELQSGF